MFKTLKNVSSNCLHVFICVVDDVFCRFSLERLGVTCIKFQRVCFCQMLFTIQLELIYESQIDHCILQQYFENVHFCLLERDQWMFL